MNPYCLPSKEEFVNSLKLYQKPMQECTNSPQAQKAPKISTTSSNNNSSLLFGDSQSSESSIEEARDLSFFAGIVTASTPIGVFNNDDDDDWVPKKKAFQDEDPSWLSQQKVVLKKIPPKTYTPSNKPIKPILLAPKPVLRTSSPQVSAVTLPLKAKKCLMENLDISPINSSADEDRSVLKVYNTKGTINSEEIAACSFANTSDEMSIKTPPTPSFILLSPKSSPPKKGSLLLTPPISHSKRQVSINSSQIPPGRVKKSPKENQNSFENYVAKFSDGKLRNRSPEDKDSLLMIPSPGHNIVISSKRKPRKRKLHVAKDFLEMF